ncbi:unnamed protein product [Leuciscus chuanchicus]
MRKMPVIRHWPIKYMTVAKAQALIGRSAKRSKPTVPVPVESTSVASFASSEQGDHELVEQGDHELVEQADLLESQVSSKQMCLPVDWTHTLPPDDQLWISKALFKFSSHNQPEMGYARVDRMWWYPPQQHFAVTGVPGTERYFGHLFFLWMPRKLWRVRLTCPHSDCVKKELTSAGLHLKIRQVVDVKTSYFMASEYLSCSFDIISQLDISHRLHFPCILTSKLACDMAVVRLLHQRGLGNSSSQVQKKLEEQHSEIWLQKVVQVLLCLCLSNTHLLCSLYVPKHRWLMQVYAQDVLQRLDEVKASITSLFGRVLKMDSTKKVARKLAGHSAGTATWVTNVGNEYGQVIMSVLTASEGFGLAQMVAGIIKRYRDAAAPPPVLLYVDRDCYGGTRLKKIFAEWKDMEIRLTLWVLLACIQDPPGVQLYVQTGTLKKGGHTLPTFRCARGSTSLESFHLLLNSDTFFQTYLLDGLARWNEYRADATTSQGVQKHHSYCGLLRHAANVLGEDVLGKKIVPYVRPHQYTGELLGVEYLYQQTGEVPKVYKSAIQELETADVRERTDETEGKDCGALEDFCREPVDKDCGALEDFCREPVDKDCGALEDFCREPVDKDCGALEDFCREPVDKDCGALEDFCREPVDKDCGALEDFCREPVDKDCGALEDFCREPVDKDCGALEDFCREPVDKDCGALEDFCREPVDKDCGALEDFCREPVESNFRALRMASRPFGKSPM